MNIKYYHEFKGLDNILNRFEILTNEAVQATEITCSDNAFALEYLESKKLEPVRGSQATLKLISKTILQFINLHTDNMQDYLVKFYRAGTLYWVGWLDSELYSEDIAAAVPYPVEFSASDFNILERLKFLDDQDAAYKDINSLIGNLKRCLDKLTLPFNRLYIGCSTFSGEFEIAASETIFHKLYIQSGNFYDEDNEPMTCREVIENILLPFGMTMVQRDANIYIYDLNTVKNGLSMKVYSAETFDYIGTENVEFSLGDIQITGHASTLGIYGFDQLINNVTIESSLYGSNELIKYEIQEGGLQSPDSVTETNDYSRSIFSKYPSPDSKEYTRWTADKYLFYKSKKNSNTLMGAVFNYTANSSAVNNFVFENKGNYLIKTEAAAFVNILARAYINTKDNPFSDAIENDERTRLMKVYCDLYLLDVAGNPTHYCFGGIEYTTSSDGFKIEWRQITGGVPKNQFVIYFGLQSLETGRICNQWLANSNPYPFSGTSLSITEKAYQKGVTVPLPPASGYMEFHMNYAQINDNSKTPGFPAIFPADKVKEILIDNVELSMQDTDGRDLSADDFEFKSYVNKKVENDLDRITLKCISANEEKLPFGKGNLLKLVDGRYELALSFSRAGESNILERLLMRTIHSNYTRKNQLFDCEIKLAEGEVRLNNPALGYFTYNGILEGHFLVKQCLLDFANAKAKITVSEYSDDVDTLSSISYE